MPKCEFCGKRFEGEATDLGEMTYICEECLNDQYVQCDRCGGWNDPTFVDYHYLESGDCVCQECFDPDSDVEEE